VSDAFSLLSRSQLHRRRARLLSRIRRRYDVVDEPFAIGPLRINFTRVTDADRVLDQVCAEQDEHEHKTHDRKQGNDLHLPYWAELWDSSIGVGHWLVQSTVRDKRVLDLGCGMGFAGAVAAAMGHRVTLVDIETPSLLFARLNTLPYAHRVRVQKLNWQTDRLADRFDVILGADVLYERAQWEHLEPFWRAHLAHEGIVLLGEPGRMTGDLFGEWITARGWTLTLLEQPIPTRPRPIRLFVLNRHRARVDAGLARGYRKHQSRRRF
jgi:predicted nicotinamide N-methyase